MIKLIHSYFQFKILTSLKTSILNKTASVLSNSHQIRTVTDYTRFITTFASSAWTTKAAGDTTHKPGTIFTSRCISTLFISACMHYSETLISFYHQLNIILFSESIDLKTNWTHCSTICGIGTKYKMQLSSKLPTSSVGWKDLKNALNTTVCKFH